MPFPETQRVIYDKNPLEMVICQLRFPPILRIDAESPVQFQSMIGQAYPVLNERAAEIQLPPELQQIAGSIVPLNLSQFSKRAFDFFSEDEMWALSLTSEYLGLTAKSYDRWETFIDRFQVAFDAFMKIYAPPFFTRAGLRYRNGIKRSKLSISSETAWSELLQPYIAGELSLSDIGPNVFDRTVNTVIQLDNDIGQVTVRHSVAKDITDNEIVYVIDSDFYTNKRLKQNETFDTLRQFNQYGRRLFRWAITDKLHEAMGPIPLST